MPVRMSRYSDMLAWFGNHGVLGAVVMLGDTSLDESVEIIEALVDG